MRIGAKAGAALAAMVAAAAMIVAAGTAVADGDDHVASGGGTARGQGTVAVMEFEFDVQQKSDDPLDAGGFFRAQGVGPGSLLLDISGPVTCVDIQDDQVGFLYTVEPGSQPAAFVGQTIFISGQDNGPGATDTLAFLGPAPAAAFPGCAPIPGVAPVMDGNIEVDDRG